MTGYKIRSYSIFMFNITQSSGVSVEGGVDLLEILDKQKKKKEFLVMVMYYYAKKCPPPSAVPTPMQSDQHDLSIQLMSLVLHHEVCELQF